jgi:hypothetical protein
MSGRSASRRRPPAEQPPSEAPPSKKKVKIEKEGKLIEVDVDEEIEKGRFKYAKFTDSDGLETYWISPE